MKSKKLLMALLIVLIVAMGLFAVACEPEVTPPTPEGAETGTYFYDANDGEYLLILNSGERFTFMVAGENKSGTYTLEGTVLTLTFNYEEDGSITAEYINDAVRLIYKERAMEFKRKVEYTVTFNSMGGSSIDDVAVYNGRTITKPADPTRDGFVFAGWYKEQACVTPYVFGSEKVTANVTLYAKWIAVEVGVLNYTVDFDLGYSEAEEIQSVQTLNGKLYDIENPTRSGYVFGGWWMSDSEQRDKLTAKYTADTVFTQDTILFAVWNESATAIMPTVNESGITWDGISGITSYSVVITNEAGETVRSEANHGSTIFNVDWNALPAGEYCVSVQSSNGMYSSVRYYTNKGLDRVSLFSVVGNVLTYNAVDNAEIYYITVECGNESHVHTMFNNGKSTSYDFSNCPMVEGGIKFTVVAAADGFASSTSRTFVVNRTLDAIAAIAVNEELETISWDPVSFATSYVVAVSVNNKAQGLVNIGNKTSYCYKMFAKGDVEINVYPVAEGYNSPEYTTVEIEKDTLATPANINVNGTVVTWDEVEGAVGYVIIINGVSKNISAASYDLAADIASLAEGADVTISVLARGTMDSLASDVVTVRKDGMYGTLKYNANVVSWRAVAGATRYEVRVNNKLVANDIVGVNSYEVELTKAGYNTISVCYYNQYDEASAYASIEVYAYTMVLYPENGEEEAIYYYAIGDKIELPTYELNGYAFDGWYNVRGGASVNGAEYTDEVFAEAGNINLYANWKARKYTVTFVYGEGEVDASAPVSAEVVFGEKFTLPVPSHVDATMAFIAWTPEKDVLSARVALADGESYKNWSIYETTEDDDIKLYPVWTKAFSFALEGSTYSVSKDPNGIHKATALTVPAQYNGINVTIIADFASCSNLEELNIPDTIQIINGNSFDGCSKLTTINVYDNPNGIPGPYSSFDGVLVISRESGGKEIAFVPEKATGKYVVPNGVTSVTSVFAGTSISEVVIPASVTAIREGAFANCKSLRTVTFENASTSLYVEKFAFQGCTALTAITLPARFALNGGTYLYQVFEGANNLLRVTVATAHTEYKSVDGVVLSKNGDTLIYYPTGRKGDYSIPAGIYNIGNYAFCKNTSLSSIIIPDSVVSIGDYAFNECSALVSVKVGAGLRTIGSHAFYRCLKLETVDFSGNTVLTTIGDYAFAAMKELSTYGSEKYVLKGVVLPESIITIGEGAFAFQAAAIIDLNIPNCTSIGRRAFIWNYSIETADLRSVETIGTGAFREAFGLYSVTIRDLVFSKTEEEEQAISYEAPFTGCNVLEVVDLGGILSSVSGSGLSASWYVRGANDPSRFFITEDGKFKYYTDGSRTILFRYLGSDENVELPATLGEATSYSIYNGAFKNKTFIKSIIVPAAVTSIDTGSINDNGVIAAYPAFYGCTSLANVYNHSSLNIVVGSDGNGYIAYYAVEVLAEGEDSKFVEQDGFFFTVNRDGEGAIESVDLSTFAGTDTTVVLPDYFVEDEVNYNYNLLSSTFTGKSVENLTISVGVTEIPASLFANNTTLKSLTINGNGNTVIGKQAFYRCTSLETIVLTGVSRIEDFAFGAYTSGSYYTDYSQYGVPVKELVFDDYLTYLGYGAFFNAYNLESVELGDNLATLSNYAFAATAVKEITLPATLNESLKQTSGNYIGRYAFANARIEKVTIAEGIEELPNYMFYIYSSWKDRAELVELTLPSTLTKIGSNCFGYQGKLTKLVIPNSVTTIGSSAFASCASLTSVVIGESVATIDSSVFTGCYKLRLVYNLSELEISVGDDATVNGGVAQYAMMVIDGDDEVSIVTEVDDEGYEFTTMNGKAYLTGYYGDDTAIITPYDYKGGTYEIAPYAFLDDYRFVSVTLGKGVTAVGDKAFYPQTQSSTGSPIANLDLNEGLISIGQEAFASAALASVTIPSTVEYIGCGAFKINKLMTKATILSGYIDSGAFQGCSSLGMVIIGEGVTGIADEHESDYNFNGAFNSCTKLYEIYNLSELEIEQGASTYGEIALYAQAIYDSLDAERAFIEVNGFNFYYDAEGTLILSSYLGSASNIILPVFYNEENEIVNYKVADSFMAENAGIVSLTIPDDTAFEIGVKAFYYCKNLTTIVMGNSVKTLDDQAFAAYSYSSSYTSLKSLTLGSGLETIGTNAFKNNALIVGELVIPNSVKTIDENAFYYCQGITSIVLGTSVETIAYRAFYNCKAVTSITYRGPVANVDSNAFQNVPATAVKKVDLAADGMAAWASIDFSSKSANMISELGELYVNGVKITEIVIPEGVTRIGNYAFAGLTGVTKVTIPSTVTEIGKGAFQDCADLVEVHAASLDAWLGITFADSDANPLKIAKHLYANGSEITDITVPSTVSEIKAYAFYNAQSITKVAITGAVVFGTDAFYGCDYELTVTVTDLAAWVATDFASAASNPLSIADKILIGGNVVTEIEIPATVTRIGNYALAGLAGVTKVTIPASVVEIGKGAFANCSALTAVHAASLEAWLGITFGDSDANPLKIAKHLYVGETEVTAVTVPAGVNEIKAYAFYNAQSITAVAISGAVVFGADAFANVNYELTISITDLAAWAATDFASAAANPISQAAHFFVNGTELTEIELNVERIGNYAFAGWTGLTKVTLGSNVTAIGESAFQGCTGLTAVHAASIEAWLGIEFANVNANPLTVAHKLYVENAEVTTLDINVEAIKAYAFNGATSITEVTLGENVKSIATDAFAGCTAIAKVNAASIEAWLGITFANANANPLSIAKHLYVGGEEVTSVTVPSTVTAINAYAFNGAASLTYVVIATEVTSIGTGAFANCGSLNTVYYMGTMEQWNTVTGDKNVFERVWNYSEEETTEKGNFWRYVEGVATPWADWVTLFEFADEWVGTWTGTGRILSSSRQSFTMVITKDSVTITVSGTDYVGSNFQESGTGYTFETSVGTYTLAKSTSWNRTSYTIKLSTQSSSVTLTKAN